MVEVSCQLWEDNVGLRSQPALLENIMTRMLNISIPLTLLLAALTLSACGTDKAPEPAPVPAPIAAVEEKPAVPEAVPEVALAPVIVEQPKVTEAPPKAKVKKAKKVVSKKVAPVAPPPAPVVAPAQVVEPKPPVVAAPEPTPPVVVAPPVKEEPGLLEQYWMWLVGVIALIIGLVFWMRKNKG